MQVRLFASAAIALGLSWGCSDPSSPSETTPIDGATPVRGTERLAWAQAGDVSRLRFRLYVDDQRVELATATCDASTPAECRAPLPALTNGIHSLALVNVLIASGIESERTASLSVQKVSAGASLTTTLPRATSRREAVRFETLVQIGDVAYMADMVAAGLNGSAQMAFLPDGRLIVANGDRIVLTVHPGAARDAEEAFDAKEMLSPPPIASLAIASHPQFLQNHLVYLGFLANDNHEGTIFRLVRLREVDDTLGEPATLFEAPVVTIGSAGPRADSTPAMVGKVPRMVFGPDHLLYVSLPAGVEFERESAASVPVASMLRLTDEGQLPPDGALRGITSHPLGFTWNPESGAMWALFAGPAQDTMAQSLSRGSSEQAEGSNPFPKMRRLRVDSGDALLLGDADREHAGFRALKSRTEAAASWTARLAAPVLLDSRLDRVGDVVAGSGGTLFVVLEGSQSATQVEVSAGAVIVRLTPSTAPAAR